MVRMEELYLEMIKVTAMIVNDRARLERLPLLLPHNQFLA